MALEIAKGVQSPKGRTFDHRTGRDEISRDRNGVPIKTGPLCTPPIFPENPIGGSIKIGGFNPRVY